MTQISHKLLIDNVYEINNNIQGIIFNAIQGDTRVRRNVYGSRQLIGAAC